MNSDFRVGPWLVQPSINTISQNGTSNRLEPKVMEVLVYLASQPGEALSKEIIIKAVWPETFVSDDVLTRSVSELRRAFQDHAREPRFIETIPKRGYRLIAPVEHSDGGNTTQAQSSTIPRSGRFPPAVVLDNNGNDNYHSSVVILCSFFLLNAGRFHDRILKTNHYIHSLAVLPLQSFSDDPKQQFLAEGVTDALITELAQIKGLRVVSRTTIMRYGRPDRPLSQIARQLDVDGIVEGTVQRSGDRVRITAQLIYGPADQHLWAKSFEREVKDMLELQSDVSREIAQEIESKLALVEQPGSNNSASESKSGGRLMGRLASTSIEPANFYSTKEERRSETSYNDLFVTG